MISVRSVVDLKTILGFGLSLAMVGPSCPDASRAVDLFEGDDEGKFVLEGEGAEGPEKVCFCAHGVAPPVGGTDENGAFGDRAVFQILEFGSEGSAGELAAAFIEEDAETPFGLGQHPVVEIGRGFEKKSFDAGDGFQA